MRKLKKARVNTAISRRKTIFMLANKECKDIPIIDTIVISIQIPTNHDLDIIESLPLKRVA